MQDCYLVDKLLLPHHVMPNLSFMTAASIEAFAEENRVLEIVSA
jgi:hypothetical protein